ADRHHSDADAAHHPRPRPDRSGPPPVPCGARFAGAHRRAAAADRAAEAARAAERGRGQPERAEEARGRTPLRFHRWRAKERCVFLSSLCVFRRYAPAHESTHQNATTKSRRHEERTKSITPEEASSSWFRVFVAKN